MRILFIRLEIFESPYYPFRVRVGTKPLPPLTSMAHDNLGQDSTLGLISHRHLFITQNRISRTNPVQMWQKIVEAWGR